MASPNTAEQKKPKSSDGPRTAPATTPVCRKTSPFAELIDAESSSSGSNKPPYHVFINHCGQDTKHTLADAIYKELDATGLRVFLDKDEIERGDFFPQVLENAIASASLHIAIFSQHYVKSTWCLAELAFMLQTMEQTHAKFFPIFYRVEPSTLRWGFKEKGIYANDFYEYEKKNRYSRETLESWKSALHKASLYNGEIINNQSDEEKAVMNVVNHVLKELKMMMLNVAEHPVGLDEREEDFDNIARQSSKSIQIVGIWGMGGAGKTTLAKHLYNKKCFSFQKSSFLFDVREAAFTKQLHEKQKELLKDLKDGTLDFYNVDKGKEILRKRLESISVLIVLDDVDHKDQLDALVPARDKLGQGSLIIVTTRELGVLRAWNISAIYDIGALDHSYAKELFCWHAFGQPSPFIDLEEIAEKFINACHGLPLSLKVLGSLLHGEELSKEYWQSQLDKLSRIVPDDIKSRLKISYDALDNEEKEMFLDVACFFIGWTTSSTIAVWNGSKWSGLHSWKRLMNKCLVELDKNNNIRMHDHLRDMGREIANKQSPYRLWSGNQIIEIQPQQVAIKVRGILSNAFGDNCDLQNGKIMLNTTQGVRILAPGSLGLKIYIGRGDIINEEFGELSRELLCFRCFDFAHTKIPSWLPLKKLRFLQLSKSQKLEELWECDEDAPFDLRELRIIRCYQLEKISGLQRLKSLETLEVYHCGALNTLPILEGLRSLKRIVIRNCAALDTLPSLADLTALEVLKVHMWSMRPCILKLPEQSERLKWVEVVANRVVVPSEKEKWAREGIICTKAVIDVRKFLTSRQELPEDVLQTYYSLSRQSRLLRLRMPESGVLRLRMPESGGLRLRMPESGGNRNAILICTIIHSIHPDSSFTIWTDRSNFFQTVICNEWVGMGIIAPKESIWVWMGTFPQQSTWLSSQQYNIQTWRKGEGVQAREGWLMRGSEQSIRQVFCRLSQR